MINRNIIKYSFIATAITFGMISTAQAATIPTPTVTVSESTSNLIFDPFVLDGLIPGVQNTAVVIENVVVNNTSNTDQSIIYKVCFEYGDYFTVFNAGRTDAPCRDGLQDSNNDPFNIVNGDPVFLGNQTEAGYAGGELVPTSPTPENPAIADGMLTALNNTFSGGNNVRRVLGATVAGDPTAFASEFANTSFWIPYAANQSNNTISVFSVTYDSNNDGNAGAVWVRDNGNSIQNADGQQFLFARFEQTGTVDVSAPSPIELPEPATIIGLLVAGTTGLITTRRR